MVLLRKTCFLVRRTSRAIEPPIAGHHVQDHLRNLKVCKSMDLDEMCLWVWELVEEVAKPLSIIYEKMWQSSEAPTNLKRKIRNMQSVSPL